MQFTEKFIQALKAKAQRYDTREQSGEGFAIRIFPSGEKSWVFIYSFEGRKRRMTLGKYPAMSLADARKHHRHALKMLENGKDPGLTKKNDKIEAQMCATVEDLIKEYIEKWAKPRKRSWEADQKILERDVKNPWGKRKAKDITRRDVILLLDKIKDRGAPIAANRVLACVRRMFNFGVERDMLSANPCVAVKAVAKENRRDRLLSIDEIRHIWRALDEGRRLENGKSAIQMSANTRLVLKLQLATAQRKGEIISAEWSEIDLVSGWWTIPAEKAKNGLTHRVPISKLALELLSEVKKLSCNSRWLFPSDKTDSHITGAAIDHAVRRSVFDDVKHWTPHDARRAAASHMTAMGISRLVVSKLLNHSEASSVTSIYDRHSYDAEKKSALELWGEKLKAILCGSELGSNVVLLKNTG